MGASVGNGKSFVSEINVTPFVDVMLVLLIIFMVTTPMLTEGLDVDLPQTQAVESLPAGNDNVVLTIRKDSSIYINEYPETMEGLAAKLATVVKDANRSLFLQADKEVPYGTVVYVMGKIKAAGIDTLGIVAERIDDEPPVGRMAPPAKGQDRSR
ncbi:MAG: ExbD/TolR family protein [Desulfovibrio sp.]|jgi:biopolymer transport protein TolR|nr:ExbD/TolR family protein [Desulfovibrio sp.]